MGDIEDGCDMTLDYRESFDVCRHSTPLLFLSLTSENDFLAEIVVRKLSK